LCTLDYLGQVSGLQCTLRLEESPGQRVLVTDSSTNGTFVNGEEVARGETRELPVGAVMTILVRHGTSMACPPLTYRHSYSMHVEGAVVTLPPRAAGGHYRRAGR
jgi:hypothetical protein